MPYMSKISSLEKEARMAEVKLLLSSLLETSPTTRQIIKSVTKKATSKLIRINNENKRIDQLSSLEKEARMVELSRLSEFIGIPGIHKSLQKILRKTKPSKNLGSLDFQEYMRSVKRYHGTGLGKNIYVKKLPEENMIKYLDDLSSRYNKSIPDLLAAPKNKQQDVLNNILNKRRQV